MMLMTPTLKENSIQFIDDLLRYCSLSYFVVMGNIGNHLSSQDLDDILLFCMSKILQSPELILLFQTYLIFLLRMLSCLIPDLIEQLQYKEHSSCNIELRTIQIVLSMIQS